MGATTGREPAGAMWYLGIHEGEAIQHVLDDMAAAVRTHPGLIANVGVSFGAVSTPSPPTRPRSPRAPTTTRSSAWPTV